MARERSRERDEACKIWIESGGKLTAKEVAEQTGVKPEQVRKWKSLDKWQTLLEKQQSKRKRGGQPGNKNAIGGGAPYGNLNAQTHGAYTAVRLANLPPEQREYIESITLDTEINMRMELQLLSAKEMDLQNRIAVLDHCNPDALYIDRVVEICVPKGDEKLKLQHDKLDTLLRERDDLMWDMEGHKPPTKAQEKRVEHLHREIAELQDKVNDAEMEREKAEFKVNMQTVIKASAFERKMKLEAELNKIHGRIIKLLDSLRGYQTECRRIRLEERKYNLAKQKLSGVFNVDPVTGEIDDYDDLEDEFDL